MAAGVRFVRRPTLATGAKEKTHMLLLKYLLLLGGAGLFAGALAIVIHDVYRTLRVWQIEPVEPGTPRRTVEIRWRGAGRLALVALVSILVGMSFVVVPSGSAGVLVSQISGTLPGALYPGVHWVLPLVQNVE